MTKPFRFAVEHYLALPLGALAALAWANCQPESYFTFAHTLSFAVSNVGMTVFVALVTKEVVEATTPGGPLHTWRRVTLPVVGALGGILGSALCYIAYLRLGDESSVLARGWPIPCATDIAVSYFIARSICPRHPAVPFLLLLALASDAIGLVIVALRYPVADVHAGNLALVAAAIGGAIALRRYRITNPWPYVLGCGALAWWLRPPPS